MSEKGTMKIVFLWEDELREAAKAVNALIDADEANYSQLAYVALTACQVALHSLDDDHTVALIGASELHKRLRDRARASKARTDSDLAKKE